MSVKKPLNIRKKNVILAILLLIVVGSAAYAVRFLADRELHKGRTLLKDRDYDAAAGEFRRVTGSKKYHVKARGLLLYSLVMEKKQRRPMQAHTGVDSSGLLRLVVLHDLVTDERVSRDNSVIRDMAARVERSTIGVRKRLTEQGIDTRDWADAERVLLSFARASWQNLDPDTVAPGQTEARVLDFTAALIGIRGASRHMESRALHHLASRLADAEAPADMAVLVHSDAFQQLLESAALSGKGLQQQRSRDILRRQRLYAQLRWVADRNDAFTDADGLLIEDAQAPNVREQLLARYPIFNQNGKPWEELSGWNFDPATIFWSERTGNADSPQDITWVYGAAAGRSAFLNYFFVFTDEMKWDLLRFDKNGEFVEQFVSQAMPVAGFEYCAATVELALNIPVVDQGRSGGIFVDKWRPFLLDMETHTLHAAGPDRDAPCVQNPDLSETDAHTP